MTPAAKIKTPEEIAIEVIRALEHGDDEHKQWLRNVGSRVITSAIRAERSRLEIAVEALRFYAAHETWDKDLMLCGSDAMRDDLEETYRSRFTPGRRARESLAKIGDV